MLKGIADKLNMVWEILHRRRTWFIGLRSPHDTDDLVKRNDCPYVHMPGAGITMRLEMPLAGRRIKQESGTIMTTPGPVANIICSRHT